MDSKIKGALHLIVNLALNGTLWIIVPGEYKIYALVALNLVQVALAYLDPTYTLKQLGVSREEYLGTVAKNKENK